MQHGDRIATIMRRIFFGIEPGFSSQCVIEVVGIP